VEAIIAMAHSLGMKTVAEGVEAVEQLILLKSLNCDYAQGFYFSEAVCASDFERLLHTFRVTAAAD
jgi:EAL domain-containing protein (putative c-di-GMP-specific phosphodiesterase class I)